MLISIIGVIVVFSIMILSHEFGHFWMAKKMGVKVEVFSFGFGPKIKSFKRGGTEYVLSLIPFGGYVKMAGDELSGKLEGKNWEFYSKPIYKRFNIIVAGSLVNYILGFLLFSFVLMLGSPVPTARIGGVLEGYPAEKAGIKAGDIIMSIEGKSVKYWEDVLDAIRDRKEGDIRVTIDRNGEKRIFSVKGRSEDAKDILGKPFKKTMIGIAPSDEVVFVKYGFFKAIAMGADTVWKITIITYQAIWGMIIGAVSVKAVAGPIGIFAMTGRAASMGLVYLLHISALISVSLAIFNLLPFPILDGGHILFLLIEKLKGKPVSRRAQEIAQNIAFALLIAFVLFVSWNDILNLPKWFK
ncbi:MAG: RIP metalloprotease RseP [Candidatus Omnitrophica bacterium]|nr:RIP metalloprotease RseP [Candidatus Omnitrophota bacterium]MBU4488478.1 RIP metalloprotease RseP [Candidatus Omnitrophota bacterium]MCG2705361.1 RIP metalloprotease RseP [Candidatus Omnitrophota bacterium]